MRETAKKMLLASYYAASQPVRYAIRRRLQSHRQLPSAVLFYHRVADTSPTPWTISNRDFAKHIHYLKRHFEVVSLATLQARMNEPSGEKMMVALTFDDGYAENFDRAVPLLLKEGIPFTYFVSSDYILTQTPFPHDTKLGLNLRPNTPEQIRFLADHGVTIGGHTRSHANMGQLTATDQIRDEILGDIRVLEALIGSSVEYFAFPYGDVSHMTQAALDILRQAKLKGMCSAYGEFNRPGGEPWHIRRIHGDPGTLRLKNWLTLDPRKLRRRKQFPFSLSTPLATALDKASDSAVSNEPLSMPSLTALTSMPTITTA